MVKVGNYKEPNESNSIVSRADVYYGGFFFTFHKPHVIGTKYFELSIRFLYTWYPLNFSQNIIKKSVYIFKIPFQSKLYFFDV